MLDEGFGSDAGSRDHGIMGSWDRGILGSWDRGILGSWDLGILGSWDLGILGSWDPPITITLLPPGHSFTAYSKFDHSIKYRARPSSPENLSF